jgi:hypothetical protein
MQINGVTLAHGIGTHAPSIIEYDLPSGAAEFRALAGLDDEIKSAPSTAATVRFMIFTNAPTSNARNIEVAFDSLGLKQPVVVRDLWSQRDLGTFTNSFVHKYDEHASGLYKFTPIVTPSK